MDKIQYIKLENEDGTFSNNIPLSVDSDHVDVNGNILTTVLNSKADALTINNNINNLSNVIEVQKSRIDNLAHLEDGSTTGDAELIDIRTGYNGRTYTSSGDGIRRQISGLTKSVNDLLLGKKYLTYPFINGNANNQGIYNVNKYRIRTKDKVLITELTVLRCNPDFRLVVVVYTSQDANRGTETSGTEVVIQPNSLVHISVRRLIEDTSEIADIDEFLYNVWIKDETIDNLNNAVNILNKTKNSYLLSDEVKSSIILEGTLYTGLFSQLTLTGYSSFTNYNYLIIDNILSNYKNSFLMVTGYIPTNQSDFGLAICLDKNNQILYTTNSENLSSNSGYSRFEIPVSADVDRIIINGKSASGDSFNPKCEYIIWDQVKPIRDIRTDIENLKNKILDDYNLNIAEALIREAKKNPFEFSDFDAAYITFVWDDLGSDIDKVAAIFAEYNFPIGIAAIPSRLTSVCNGLQEASQGYSVGMTAKEVCDRVIELGGEIMSHNSNVINITNQYDYNFMYNYFIKTRKTLEDNGYTIRGIIRAGGNGAISHTPEIEKWLICNYEYSNIGTAINYSQDRVNIGQGVTYIKTQIDNAIANNNWVKVMCHGLSSSTGGLAISETDLRAILDYCQSQNITVVTYGYIFDNFSSSKLLNNISN